jgi:large subunit ribosomal protein L32e
MTETKNNKSDLEKALELRTRVKKNKPKFVRQESWRYKRVNKNWRRPRGLDSKMRKKVKGWPPTVNVGYRGPKASRGLHPSGYWEVLVHNTNEVKDVDPETQAIRIAHTVGKRKRGKILVEARKRNIKVLNFRELEKAVREEEKESLAEENLEEEKGEARGAEEEEAKRGEKTRGGKGNNDKS